MLYQVGYFFLFLPVLQWCCKSPLWWQLVFILFCLLCRDLLKSRLVSYCIADLGHLL